jgi:hypothetical protein
MAIQPYVPFEEFVSTNQWETHSSQMVSPDPFATLLSELPSLGPVTAPSKLVGYKGSNPGMFEVSDLHSYIGDALTTELQTYLDAELLEATTALQTSLDTQIDALQVEVDSLQTSFEALQTSVDADLASLQTNVNSQISTATSSLQTSINDGLDALSDEMDASLATLTGNASAASVTAAGTPTSRLLSARFADTLHARDFGAVGTGLVDDAAAIQQAINTLEARGGGTLLFGHGTYLLNSGVRVRKSNVRLLGEAGGNQHDALSATSDFCTRFLWGGANGGTMVTVEPDANVLGQRVSGAAVKRIALTGSNGTTRAGTGLQVRSCFHGDFDVYVEDTAVHGVYVGVIDTLGEARDTQHCRFWIQGKQVGTAAGTILTLDGQEGAILPVEANTSFNVFYDVFGLYKFNTGLLLSNADNNLFLNTRLFRFGGGTGVGVVLCAGVDALRTARANRFYQLSPGAGGVIAQGTEVAVIPSNRNRIDSYDTENTAPLPFYGAGARLFMRDDNGVFDELSASSPQAAVTVHKVEATHSGFTGDLIQTTATRAASTGFLHLHAQTDAGTNNSFLLRGDGNAWCDGAWTGGGADYAEWMEWEDGNPSEEDRRGLPVVSAGSSKIRLAIEGDPPTALIGAVSAVPAVVGSGDTLQWRGKYLRDVYGSLVLDIAGERVLNPDFDPELTYTSREDRPEWCLVGLLGRLRLRTGTPRGDRWVFLGEVAPGIEEWLVR